MRTGFQHIGRGLWCLMSLSAIFQ